MLGKKANSFDLIRGVCLAVGILIGMIVVKVAFDFGPILGGAIGGGFGALLGMAIYALIGKKKQL